MAVLLGGSEIHWRRLPRKAQFDRLRRTLLNMLNPCNALTLYWTATRARVSTRGVWVRA